MGKNIGKNISKNVSSKYSQKLLYHATDALKTGSKRGIQKTSEATGDLMVIKLLIELQKLHHRIIQKQMQKYLKKDICLQKKDRKLLII